MPIVTTTQSLISSAELARANALEVTVAEQAVQITTLQAELASMRPGLYVDGNKLRNRYGAELRLRGVEVMVNVDVKNRGYATFCAQLRNDLKCNSVQPLFQAQYGSLGEVGAFLLAAKNAFLIVGVNADHQSGPFGESWETQAQRWTKLQAWVALQGAEGVKVLFDGVAKAVTNSGSSVVVDGVSYASTAANLARFVRSGREWLCSPGMVTLLNSYSNIYLQCEIETEPVASNAAWLAEVQPMVAQFRAAGHLHPIKVGAPAGGRDVKWALAVGATVLAADPRHNVIFGFQVYWSAATGLGWYYQTQNGFANALAGSLAALSACSASGLCFVVGVLDGITGDVGLTDEAALLDQIKTLGMSCAHWVATGDGTTAGNNLYDWDFSPQPARAITVLLVAKFGATKAAFPDAAI